MTMAATNSPATAGTTNSRQLWACGNGPSRARCSQSMVRRKQTTKSPEKIPMKTQRIRKNTSSLKTPSRVENKWRSTFARTTETDDFPEDVFSEEAMLGAVELIDW